MTTQQIPLKNLHAHPLNSNVMPEPLLAKLAAHIERTGQYPPIIVRPAPTGTGYQILDGHHRKLALERIGASTANCVIWQADDEQALLLLATLNRLQGQDDAKKRSALLNTLAQRMPLDDLAAALPEQRAHLDKLLALHKPPPAPRPPQSLADMPQAVHFFLLPDQRKKLDRKLADLGGTREEALMQLVSL